MGAAVAGGCVLAWLTALSAYDIRQRRLPNYLTVPGAAAVLIVAVVAGRGTAALLGALALFAVYLGVHLAAPAAMGAGDVKLAIGVGALTGAFGFAVWVLAAFGATADGGLGRRRSGAALGVDGAARPADVRRGGSCGRVRALNPGDAARANRC